MNAPITAAAASGIAPDPTLVAQQLPASSVPVYVHQCVCIDCKWFRVGWGDV